MKTDLDARILSALAYADLFGAGLSEPELRQRLFGAGSVHPDDLRERLVALRDDSKIGESDGTYRLGATETHDDVSGQVAAVRAWARFAGRLPFVRFIGLTGSLAKGSPGTDADLFVVAAAGRGYLAFALLKTIGLVAARLRGIRICVNFLVDERHLGIPLHDAFTATEFVTMVPLYDSTGTGQRLWDANRTWVGKLCGSALPWIERADRRGMIGRMIEAVVPAALDDAVRGWKRRRFIARKGESVLVWPDVAFEPGFLKQHDASHRREILGKFRAKLKLLGLDDAWVEPVG